ncbi:MAG: membrane protein insertion efficiency factor YidD [Candidatus Omnitrophica bacterium]|nr:membrane protein insertion efficiency factor YidD [Candidatus Omnitrophota bacterium]
MMLKTLSYIYHNILSSLMLPSCRFVPSCSKFAEDAITIHGPWRGGMKAVARLLRCHPFNRGGFDPVTHGS